MTSPHCTLGSFLLLPTFKTMKPIEEKLEHMNKVTPDLPLHRAHLRRALLASKPEGSNYSFMKKLLPVGLVLALLLMFNAVQKPDSTLQITPMVSAQELVDQVSQQIQSLTPEEVMALEERLGYPGSLLSDTLQEAQLAADLTDLPLVEETVTASDGNEYCIVVVDNLIAFASDQSNCISRFVDFRSVIFTSSDDSLVVMMVDKNLLPAAIFSFHPGLSMTISGTGSESSPLMFSTEEEASHYGTFNFDRSLSLEENMAQLIEGLPSAFEQVTDSETVTVDSVTDCTSWTSEDGQMGGGGC